MRRIVATSTIDPATTHWMGGVSVAMGTALFGILLVRPPDLATYLSTWLLMGCVFLAMKALVIQQRRGLLRELGVWRLAGFVFLWPGMDIAPFRGRGGNRSPRSTRHSLPPLAVAAWGIANLLAGAAFLGWVAGWPIVRLDDRLRAGVGIAGLFLLVPFGLFHLLAAFWNARGVHVEKQWDFLPASRSLGDYWSRRWNRAFHDFARDQVYEPLRHRIGKTAGLMATFLLSGVIHDLVVSVPAEGGYGLPTLYFLIQGVGIGIERRFVPAGPMRRLFGAIVLLAPIGLLFHAPFLERVVLPQMEALHAGQWLAMATR